MFPRVGDIVARRYRVESQIGSGGFAVVYRATDLELGTPVALKVMRREKEGYTPETRLRFEREATVLRGLHHPNIVRLLDHGSADLLYLVFELVDGEDLSVLLGAGPLPVDRAMSILRQLLTALAAAHHAGILHRDVKPENIRVIGGGPTLRVKLLDFGIARPTDDGSPGITKTGELVGTPRYMSPEQLTEQPLGPASDVYPAGIVGLEMLLGRDAMHGNGWMDQLDRLRTGHVFVLPGVEEYGARLMHVLNRMTARGVEERYPSAQAALRALDALSGPASPPPTTKLTERDSRPRWVASAAVVAVVLLAALAFALRPSPDEEAQPDPPKTRNVETLLTPHPDPETVAPVEPPRAPSFGSDGCDLDALDLKGLPTHRPSNYDSHTAYPLIVMLRDRYTSSDEWLTRSGFPKLADEQGFIVIAPKPVSSKPWRAWREELEPLRTAVNRTMDAACIDPGRIFIVSHGHGTPIGFRLACQSWVAGLASYANQTSSTPCESFSTPYLMLHPRDSKHQRIDDSTPIDPACEAESTKTYEERERAWRARFELRDTKPEPWHVPGASCQMWKGTQIFAACTYDGGRNWPGTQRERFSGLSGLIDCDGPQPAEFEPAPLIWNFFKDLQPLDRQAVVRALGK